MSYFFHSSIVTENQTILDLITGLRKSHFSMVWISGRISLIIREEHDMYTPFAVLTRIIREIMS